MAKTINIRGSKVSIVTSTSQATGGTAIGHVVDNMTLPYKEYARRKVTELKDRVDKYRVSRLATLEGELSFDVHVYDDLSTGGLPGTEAIVRVDIPTDAATSTSQTHYVQVFCPVVFSSEEPDAGDDETDVKLKVTGLPMGEPLWGTNSN